MPLYEYECDACGHRFEVIQKFSDAPIDKCPVCGRAVHKLQSAPAFHLKGTGWYATDYAKSGTAESKGGKDGKKPDGSSGAGDSGSSSDNKPASSEAASPSAPSSSGTSSAASSTATSKPETPKT